MGKQFSAKKPAPAVGTPQDIGRCDVCGVRDVQRVDPVPVSALPLLQLTDGQRFFRESVAPEHRVLWRVRTVDNEPYWLYSRAEGEPVLACQACLRCLMDYSERQGSAGSARLGRLPRTAVAAGKHYGDVSVLRPPHVFFIFSTA